VTNKEYEKEKELTQWGKVAGQYMLRPIRDRILVKEDPFKSRMDCSKCGGKGHIDETCPECLGTKKNKTQGYKYEVDCINCTPKKANGEIAETPFNRPTGYVLCDLCNGRGGTIVIPDDSKMNTTTGDIIAIGKNVTEFKVGCKIMYTNYTGTKFNILDIPMRMMCEGDVLCEVKQLKKNVDVIEEGKFTDLENLGEARS
jgi:co-chaperonin GroES (HSP10)